MRGEMKMAFFWTLDPLWNVKSYILLQYAFLRSLSLHYSSLPDSYLHYEYLVGCYTRYLPLGVFLDKV